MEAQIKIKTIPPSPSVKKDSPVHVLIVDDDYADLEPLIERWNQARVKLEVDVVSNGVPARNYLRKEGPYGGATRPDLVLLDLNMPLMDGRDVLSEMKADESLKSIPVIVLTHSQLAADIRRSFSDGANA